MPSVAITGGIACGKSALGRLLEERGAEVLDADAVVHRLQRPGAELSTAVEREFGGGVLDPDGGVDRSKLAALVFAEPARLARLNAISHPPVRAWFRRWRETPTQAWAKVALIPLLFECGWEGDWDLTVCVACEPELQLERLRERGLREDEGRRRIQAQWAPAEKMRRADIVVRNDADWNDLAASAERLKHTILEKYAL